jgi:hypothetical protein
VLGTDPPTKESYKTSLGCTVFVLITNQNRRGSNINVVEEYQQINSAAGANGGPSTTVKYVFPNAISSGGKQFFLYTCSFFR